MFRVYNGCLILGHVLVSAYATDVLADAEREADSEFGLWTELREVNYR